MPCEAVAATTRGAEGLAREGRLRLHRTKPRCWTGQEAGVQQRWRSALFDDGNLCGMPAACYGRPQLPADLLASPCQSRRDIFLLTRRPPLRCQQGGGLTPVTTGPAIQRFQSCVPGHRLPTAPRLTLAVWVARRRLQKRADGSPRTRTITTTGCFGCAGMTFFGIFQASASASGPQVRRLPSSPLHRRSGQPICPGRRPLTRPKAKPSREDRRPDPNPRPPLSPGFQDLALDADEETGCFGPCAGCAKGCCRWASPHSYSLAAPARPQLNLPR